MTKAANMKLVVIHGWGGSYLEAAERLLGLLETESYWYRGSILVPARKATLLRHLLNDPSEDPYYTSLCKLIVSRFLMSPPLPAAQKQQIQSFSRFAEDRIRRDFPKLGIPFAPAARRQRASQLCAEAEQELQPLLQVLALLQTEIQSEQEDRTENGIRHLLHRIATEAGLQGSAVPLLESLRDMHETGGDLDTVASAVLYATWLQQQARQAARPFRYGHEYRFVFVNYHESLRSLTSYAPANLYLADLPVAAFPELEDDIRFLAEQGVHTARFEDHHPYEPERKQALEKLVEQKLLGHLWLSGPVIGEELDSEDVKCAADMVFESCVVPGEASCPAATRLRDAAHGEDFVTNRSDFGVLLTNLIKGGICKIELAQILLEAMPGDDALAQLETRGWAALPSIWRQDLDQTAEGILENAVLLQLQDTDTRIVCAKAVHAEPGTPKLPTGKAIEFLSRSFPDAHYAFYCFGASLMVARRLDHADTALNLGSMMPVIGTTSDGGHAGAAVCRPDANPAFPNRLLGHITDANFASYARYLGGRLTQAGYPVATLRNVSQPSRARWTSSNRKLITIIASAFAAGLVLITFFPAFRPAAIRESNEDFFPQIGLDDGEPFPETEVSDL